MLGLQPRADNTCIESDTREANGSPEDRRKRRFQDKRRANSNVLGDCTVIGDASFRHTQAQRAKIKGILFRKAQGPPYRRAGEDAGESQRGPLGTMLDFFRGKAL